MTFHKDDECSLEPCKHMEGLLNRTADGSASKLGRWYALNHAAGCKRCGNFLTRVTALLGQLRGLKAPLEPAAEGLPAERWDCIEAAWTEAEG